MIKFFHNLLGVTTCNKIQIWYSNLINSNAFLKHLDKNMYSILGIAGVIILFLKPVLIVFIIAFFVLAYFVKNIK